MKKLFIYILLAILLTSFVSAYISLPYLQEFDIDTGDATSDPNYDNISWNILGYYAKVVDGSLESKGDSTGIDINEFTFNLTSEIDNEYVTLEWDSKITDGNSYFPILWDDSHNLLVQFFATTEAYGVLNANEIYYMSTGGVWISLGNYYPETWQTIKLEVNLTSDLFKLTINESVLGSDVSFNSYGLSKVKFSSGENDINILFMDNFTFYTNTSGEPVPSDDMTLNYFSLSPANNSNIGTATDLFYILNNVNGSANCSLYLNNTNIANMTGLGNETYNFSFDSSYWYEDIYNELNITCIDEKLTTNQVKWLFVDAVMPLINYINYEINGTTKALSYDSFDSTVGFNLTTESEDNNNYLLNITIYHTHVDDIYFTDEITNCNTTQNRTIEINLTNYMEGWYKVNVSTADAHTKKKIDFKKDLKPKEYAKADKIGKTFDDKVKTYLNKNKIKKFDLIESKDRYKFNVSFQKSITSFDIYVEGESKVEYLGNRYGYDGHFIIDNNYWYDLENDGGVFITNVAKEAQNLYKVTMQKPELVENVIFESVGIINRNSEVRYFFVNNRSTDHDRNQTLFTTGINVSTELTASTTYTAYFEIERYVDFVEAYFGVISNETATNLNVTLSKQTDSLIYKSGEYVGAISTGNFITNLTAISEDCSCSGCTILNEVNCSIPLNIVSDTATNISFNNLFVSYNFRNATVEIHLNDSHTKQPITDNMTVQIVGSIFQAEGNTDNGIIYFNFPFNTSGQEVVSIRGFQTNGTDYSIVIRQQTLLQGKKYNITLFLTNTSDIATTNLVTFHVQDQDRYTLEDAVIHIQKQDPATNTYLDLTDLTTNSQGEATTILVVDTVFYKFVVDYDGETIYTSPNPVTISLNDDDIYLVGVVEGNPSDYTEKTLNTVGEVKYYGVSDTSGYFKLEYTGTQQVTACLRVNIANGTGSYNQEEKCQTANSGSIQSSTFSPLNITYYEAIGVADPDDGGGNRILDSIGEYIGLPEDPIGSNNGLLFLLVVVVLAAFGFVESPIVGILILGVGSLLVGLMSVVTIFGIAEGMIILSLCVIAIFSIARLRRT